MTIIQTKYSVSETVFHASTATEQRQHPCPDCNDTRKWSAISPAGNEYSFACPRCTARFQSYDNISLKYTAHVPQVSARTIGSVQYNSAPRSYDSGARYMCHETGVGSGSVYNEADLFATHDEAMVAATAKAKDANVTTPWVVEKFNKTLEICDYQLESALLKSAQDKVSVGGQLLWNVTELFDTIAEASDKDAILEAIDDYKNYPRERDMEKLFALVDAARAEVVA